ncbi:POLR2J [Symbiodinium microadriaticum]|nr:POLR2J [Symbiodinium microadriaticum]
MANAGMFILGKEDHTMGNIIRLQLLRDPSVRFAGYRMPHPLVDDCHIKVQTMSKRTTPVRAFQDALQDLKDEVAMIERSFEASAEAFSHSEGL